MKSDRFLLTNGREDSFEVSFSPGTIRLGDAIFLLHEFNMLCSIRELEDSECTGFSSDLPLYSFPNCEATIHVSVVESNYHNKRRGEKQIMLQSTVDNEVICETRISPDSLFAILDMYTAPSTEC